MTAGTLRAPREDSRRASASAGVLGGERRSLSAWDFATRPQESLPRPPGPASARRLRRSAGGAAGTPVRSPRFAGGFSPPSRPQIRRDDPLNLSILLSGGKETNQDSLSNGE